MSSSDLQWVPRVILRVALLFFIGILSGCTSLSGSERSGAELNTVWAGRLQIQIDGNPPQQFAVAFELEGSPQQGQLALLSPLGSTLANIAWTPAGARLTDSTGRTERHPSAEHLLEVRAGASVPLVALFSWLAGQPANVEGWTVDLSNHAKGRLLAYRRQPAPAATLRIILDEPPHR